MWGRREVTERGETRETAEKGKGEVVLNQCDRPHRGSS